MTDSIQTTPNLNARQLEAVTATEGYVRVIAGAGSGKTRALAHRFAYLVREIGIPPSNILCVTFTNKSANEMRQRIRRLTGDDATGYIDTFHSFCVTVLQEESHAVSYPRRFLVLDNADIDAMLKIVYDERGLTLRDMTFSAARDMIEILKTKDRPDYYLDLVAMPIETLYEKYIAATEPRDMIFYGYLYQQKKCFGLDYNDLILFVLYIFSINDEIRTKWQMRLNYIMIDEFQDVDALQYRLMQTLCAYHNNLFVVGDPDQTIYSWRGADVRFLMDFDKAFPDVKTIMMMQNYRSRPQILAAANSLIEKNGTRIKKDLIPMRESGESVRCRMEKTELVEAQCIAKEIARFNEAGAPYADMTILYRAHYVTRALEDALIQAEIPYTIYSGVPFFERAEIKDALSYLRLVVLGDDLSFLRVCNLPKRNLGERRIRFLSQYAAENGCTLLSALGRTLDDEIFKNTKAKAFVALIERFNRISRETPISVLLSDLLDKSGYEEMRRTEGSRERLDNLAELKQAIYEYETMCGEECAAEDFLSHVALMTNADAELPKNAVKLMTVHAAKGLEFPNVFLCGMNEGVFPSKRVDTRARMEEERRLMFVAMTRAEERLYLSGSEGRNHDGSFRYPSRFLFDIDQNLLAWEEPPQESLVAEAKWYAELDERRLDAGEEAPIPVGRRVCHAIMGNGTILAWDGEKGAYIVAFDDFPTPRSITKRAKLTVLDSDDAGQGGNAHD